MTLLIGIDGGGTGCRAALATPDGAVIGRGRSGPANIRTDLAGAARNITEAAALAFAEAGRDTSLMTGTDAVLGLAGSNVGDYARRLPALLPFRRSLVESDAVIALAGALGSHDGAITILGTGTICLARRAGELRRLGGWGFVLSDLGGGARLGRKLLEETLLAHDSIRAESRLTDAVLARFANRPGDIVEFTLSAAPGDYAAFAPLLFEHDAKGDPVAARIIAGGVGAVSEMLDALDLVDGERLCLLGGLADRYTPRLPERHAAKLHAPIADALGGAVALAVRQFGARS